MAANLDSPKMDIKPDDLVLEVGSGDKPFPRSDVLLDKLPEDSSEREAGRGLVTDRPFVIGDVETLPFADKSFDYIIASHVLEHANNPAKFLDELARVGKRGYVETPLPLRERVFDFPFHRWYVYQEGKKLVLVKKTPKSKNFFSGMKTSKRRELYHLEGEKLLNLEFEWQGKIDYRIIKSEPEEFLKELDRKLALFLKEKETEPKYWLQKVKSGLLLIPGLPPASLMVKNRLFKFRKLPRNLIGGSKRRKIDIFSLIVCPVCKKKLKKLEKLQTALVCLGCRREYGLFRGKIPELLA